MSMNFWVDRNGNNTLKGLPFPEGFPNSYGELDPDEMYPSQLPSDFILDFLAKYPEARRDFLILYPALTELEKNRVDPLYQRALTIRNMLEPNLVSDALVRRITAPIHTAGPRGGRGGGTHG